MHLCSRSRQAFGLVIFCAITSAASGEECEVADRLAAARVHELARKEYSTVLKKTPSSKCAAAGLELAAAEHANARLLAFKAQAYRAAGREDLARESALAAIVTDPTSAEALRLWSTTAASETPAPRADGKALVDGAILLGNLGHPAAALELLKEAAKKGEVPDLQAVRLLAEPHTEVQETARGLKAIASAGGEIAVVALVAVLGIPLAARLLLAVLRTLLPTRLGGQTALQINEFDSPSQVPLARALPARIKGDLLELRARKTRSGPPLVASPLTPLPVPTALQTLPTVGPIAAALTTVMGGLIPDRTAILTGTIHEALPERGAGMTLCLGARGSVVASVTIWERDFGPVRPVPSPAVSRPAGELPPVRVPPTVQASTANLAGYYALTEPAATWIAFKMTEHRW